MRAVLVLCGCLSAAACAPDPSAETPVDLRAGLYQVSVGGGTVVDLKGGARNGEICLDSYSASELAKDPVQALAGSWEGCSTTIEPRKGNAIGGARTCEERATPLRMTYTGRITPDSFLIHGTVAQGSDESESRMHLGSGDFAIAGKRVRDCSL